MRSLRIYLSCFRKSRVVREEAQAHERRILLPIYTWWQLPYYYAGVKLYDLLAGKENMESAYWMGRGKAIEAFPMLKTDGLVGGVVYYDGELNLKRRAIQADLSSRST